MDQKVRLGLIGGLVLLGGVVFYTLSASDDAPPPAAPTVERIVETVDYADVLSVSTNLQRGSRVTPDQLTWIQWPEAALTPALVVKDDSGEVDIIGQLEGSIVRDPLTPGEPVTLSKFIRAGEAGIMAALLKPGMRAVTVRISVDTASGGFILPGDKVDIMLKEVLAAQPGGDGRPNIQASTIFKNVTVLAIDQSYTNNPELGAAMPGSTATLELSPDDAAAITVAQDRGDLTLLLRGFTGANSKAVSRAYEPKKKSAPKPPLTIYRQGEVETVQLQQPR